MTKSKQEWEKEFKSMGIDTEIGEPEYNWLKSFISKQITLSYKRGVKEERQRVVEMLRKLKRTGQCTCMEDYSSCPYNIALSDVKEHLNLPSDKETI